MAYLDSVRRPLLGLCVANRPNELVILLSWNKQKGVVVMRSRSSAVPYLGGVLVPSVLQVFVVVFLLCSNKRVLQQY